MKGSINYLQSVHDICEKAKKDCKRCQLGEKRRLEDNYCPRLTDPRSWDADRIVAMVRSVEVKNDG